MKVLHVAAYFAPAFIYGGPPRSILGLCKALRRQGVEASVFTTTANGTGDFPASVNAQESYEDVPVRYFQRRWPKRFFSVNGLAEALAATASNYDLLHLHGLWNFTVWTAAREARRVGLPYLISPRGMLDRGAMAHEAGRKLIAYHLAERKNLLAAQLLHATSASEAEAITSYELNKPITIIPNGIEFDDGKTGRFPTQSHEENRNQLASLCEASRGFVGKEGKLVVFLGRIHPIKRLDLLAESFIQIKQTCPAARLVIAGPDENGHRKMIEPLFASVAESVVWAGELGQEAKAALLREASVLVSCSDSENFGLSVPEALAAGTPVVVTRTCPWAEVETIRCGFWVEQNAQAMAEAVSRLLESPEQAVAMGERGARWVRGKFGWDTVAVQMVDCYKQVLDQYRAR